jgi:hypothetical protein
VTCLAVAVRRNCSTRLPSPSPSVSPSPPSPPLVPLPNLPPSHALWHVCVCVCVCVPGWHRVVGRGCVSLRDSRRARAYAEQPIAAAVSELVRVPLGVSSRRLLWPRGTSEAVHQLPRCPLREVRATHPTLSPHSTPSYSLCQCAAPGALSCRVWRYPHASPSCVCVVVRCHLCASQDCCRRHSGADVSAARVKEAATERGAPAPSRTLRRVLRVH